MGRLEQPDIKTWLEITTVQFTRMKGIFTSEKLTLGIEKYWIISFGEYNNNISGI
jgi:hypothetical protein